MHNFKKEHLNLLLSPEEKQLLESRSSAVGLTESEFLRKLIRHNGIPGVPLLDKEQGGQILELLNDVSNQLSILVYNTKPGSTSEHDLLQIQVFLMKIVVLLSQCMNCDGEEDM